MFKELGVSINSVKKLLKILKLVKYLLDKISKAEAIWFAGGNHTLIIGKILHRYFDK